MNVHGQHALITGGSSGIGKALAHRFAIAGANLTLIARSPAPLAAAQQELFAVRSSTQQRIEIQVADVSDLSPLETALYRAIDNLGPPEFLINCAGITHPGYFQDLPIEIFERIMAVNYFGTLYAIKTVLPLMLARQSGHLVLISSGVGLMGIFGYTPYSPSKFALRGLAESLRGELQGSGVQLAIVYPPDTDTPQLAAEAQTKPPETRRISQTSTILSAETVAQSIWEGMQHRQFAITPGLEMTLLARLHSLLGPALNWYFDRIVAQVRSPII